MTSNFIEALLKERRGYVMRGKKDRIAAIDSQLKELGYETKQTADPIEVAAVEPEVERTVAPKVRKRNS